MDITSLFPCHPGARFHLTGINIRSLPLIRCQQQSPNRRTTRGTSCFGELLFPLSNQGVSRGTRGALPHPSSAQSKPRRSLVFLGTFLVSLWWHSRGLFRRREQAQGTGGKATRGAAELRAQGRPCPRPGHVRGPAMSEARATRPHRTEPSRKSLCRAGSCG